MGVEHVARAVAEKIFEDAANGAPIEAIAARVTVALEVVEEESLRAVANHIKRTGQVPETVTRYFR
jgi:hypothetical protein